jgi:hypothetical protein
LPAPTQAVYDLRKAATMVTKQFWRYSTGSAITIVAVGRTTWNLLNTQLDAVGQPKRVLFRLLDPKWYSLHCPTDLSDLIEGVPTRLLLPMPRNPQLSLEPEEYSDVLYLA